MLSPDETRVLVVEDNALDRKLLAVHLAAHGYEPRMVTDGVEAWDILEHAPDSVDVVLLDRSMPRMGGLELLAKMKALGMNAALEGPEAFDATIAKDLVFWKDAIDKIGIGKP